MLKRFLLEDGVHTLAFGHSRITVHVFNDPRPEGQDTVINVDPFPEEDEEEQVEMPAEPEVVAAASQPASPSTPDIPIQQQVARPWPMEVTTAHTPRYLPPTSPMSIGSNPSTPIPTPFHQTTPSNKRTAPRPLGAPPSKYLPPTTEAQQPARPAALSDDAACRILGQARAPQVNVSAVLHHVGLRSGDAFELIMQAKQYLIERNSDAKIIQRLKEYYALMLEYHR